MLALELAGDGAGYLFPVYTKLFEVEIEDGKQMIERFKSALIQIITFDSIQVPNPRYKEMAGDWLKKAREDIDIVIAYINKELYPLSTSTDPK